MRLHRDAKAELIKHVPLFSNCSKKELRKLASIADEIDFHEGKVLIRGNIFSTGRKWDAQSRHSNSDLAYHR